MSGSYDEFFANRVNPLQEKTNPIHFELNFLAIKQYSNKFQHEKQRIPIHATNS